MMRSFLCIFFFLFIRLTVSGQDHNAAQLVARIVPGHTMPDNLRSGKSLLLIIAPEDFDWKIIAEKAQPVMKNAGIDAVATYYFQDLLSGVESFNGFITSFAGRGISNLVIIVYNGTEYQIIVTAFNEQQFIMDGQPGWKTTHNDLDMALRNTYLAAANSGQALSNFLILDEPFYGKMTYFITGRRAEFYDLNFSSEKLAVLPFADTAEIRQVMQQYPYEYKIIDPSLSEKEIRSNGFQFILYYVHASAEATKEILGYDTNPKETTYVTETIVDGKPVMKSFDKNKDIYKFYIKHIYSGNTFLGKKWDAAPRWQDALSYYINNLRDELM